MFKRLLAVTGFAAALGAGTAHACDSYEEVTSAWLPIMQTTAYYVAHEVDPFTGRMPDVIYEHNLRDLWGANADAVKARFPASSYASGNNGADVRHPTRRAAQ